MCSKRWAKPVRPARSFFEPTWYHWFTFTIGSLRSTWRITWSPFGSVYFSNSTFGALAVAFGAAARGVFFTGALGAGAGGAAVEKTAGSEMRINAEARRKRFTESPFG